MYIIYILIFVNIKIIFSLYFSDYNPYLIPYYLALYIFSKTLVNMLLTIIQDKDIRNKPERIGRHYLAIKGEKINK